MIFVELPLAGAFLIEFELAADERGSFARVFDAEEFRVRALDPRVAQVSTSSNDRRGTLRGLHFQEEPHGEAKLVRCTRGVIWDVIVDLRRDSPTHRHWFGVELSPNANRALYVPPGLAHGFITLADASDVAYQISVPYAPSAARGVRYDDPAFGIRWPEHVKMISERDRAYPDYNG